MWILFAFLSAFFAGITSVLAKCGIKKTDSTVATAIRTVIVLLFSVLMVFIAGSQSMIFSISKKTLVFLILSGLSTGASWLCYFKALRHGSINKVVPIDKSSTVLTFILAAIFFSEFSWIGALGITLVGVGTYLMISRSESAEPEEKSGKWFIYAVGSAVFASLTSILGKVGIEGVESNLGTAIRTVVVLFMAWLMVFVTGKRKEVVKTEKKELFFISASGLATGASWLCYYKALSEGPASVVVPIDKLSIVVTVVFSYFVFGEKLRFRSAVGLLMMILGTMIMIIGV